MWSYYTISLLRLPPSSGESFHWPTGQADRGSAHPVLRRFDERTTNNARMGRRLESDRARSGC